MSKPVYVGEDGTVIEPNDLTPELMKELGISADVDDDDDYDDRQDHESEDDYARGEGFWIDDDGNWIPIEDDDLYW